MSEVSSTSWFERLGQSIKGVLGGGALFLLAFPVLWMNEGCSAHTEAALGELKTQVVTVDANSINPANEEKPVCVSGDAVPQGKIADADFGMPETDAIRVVRRLEMYQWEEKVTEKTEKKFGGGEETVKEYHYNKVWSADKPQTAFHDQRTSTGERVANPPAKRFESRDDIWTPRVKLGAYEVPRDLLASLTPDEKLTPNEAWIDRVPSDLRKSLALGKDGMLYCSNDEGQEVKPDRPVVGDLRIAFSIVKPQPVTVLAVQKSGSFNPFVASNKTTLQYLRPGVLTADVMLAKAEQENTMMTWIGRAVGFLMMAFGLYLVFNPLVTFADVIPFVGTLLGTGIALFAAVVSLALSLITIAVAWLWYRPLLGGALLAGGLLLIGLLFFLGRRMKAARAAAK